MFVKNKNVYRINNLFEVLLYGTVSSKRNNDVILVYQHCDPNLLPAVIQR